MHYGNIVCFYKFEFCGFFASILKRLYVYFCLFFVNFSYHLCNQTSLNGKCIISWLDTYEICATLFRRPLPI